MRFTKVWRRGSTWVVMVALVVAPVAIYWRLSLPVTMPPRTFAHKAALAARTPLEKRLAREGRQILLRAARGKGIASPGGIFSSPSTLNLYAAASPAMAGDIAVARAALGGEASHITAAVAEYMRLSPHDAIQAMAVQRLAHTIGCLGIHSIANGNTAAGLQDLAPIAQLMRGEQMFVSPMDTSMGVTEFLRLAVEFAPDAETCREIARMAAEMDAAMDAERLSPLESAAITAAHETASLSAMANRHTLYVSAESAQLAETTRLSEATIGVRLVSQHAEPNEALMMGNWLYGRLSGANFVYTDWTRRLMAWNGLARLPVSQRQYLKGVVRKNMRQPGTDTAIVREVASVAEKVPGTDEASAASFLYSTGRAGRAGFGMPTYRSADPGSVRARLRLVMAAAMARAAYAETDEWPESAKELMAPGSSPAHSDAVSIGGLGGVLNQPISAPEDMDVLLADANDPLIRTWLRVHGGLAIGSTPEGWEITFFEQSSAVAAMALAQGLMKRMGSSFLSATIVVHGEVPAMELVAVDAASTQPVDGALNASANAEQVLADWSSRGGGQNGRLRVRFRVPGKVCVIRAADAGSALPPRPATVADWSRWYDETVARQYGLGYGTTVDMICIMPFE